MYRAKETFFSIIFRLAPQWSLWAKKSPSRSSSSPWSSSSLTAACRKKERKNHACACKKVKRKKEQSDRCIFSLEREIGGKIHTNIESESISKVTNKHVASSVVVFCQVNLTFSSSLSHSNQQTVERKNHDIAIIDRFYMCVSELE